MSSLPPPDDRLSGYLDGELAPDERRAVDDLLQRSDAWRAGLAEVAWARDAVRALPAPDAPPGFWERMAKSDNVRDIGTARSARWVSRSRMIAGVAAAAIVAAVLFLPSESSDSGDASGGPGRVLTVNAPRIGTPSLDAGTVIEREADAESSELVEESDGFLDDVVDTVFGPFGW